MTDTARSPSAPGLGRWRGMLCVTTFRRPHALARALESVHELRIPDGWELDIVVVDNDDEPSARPVVERLRERGGRARYVHEGERGISHARNRAVAESAGAEWLLFVDDDQVVDPDWLERLDDALGDAHADVLVGPCLATFEVEPPAWIRRGGFFDRRGVPGVGPAPVPYWLARTGGVLVRTSCFAQLGSAPFDAELALSGGEDRAFFAEIERAGGRIVWVPGAVVHESIPPSRATVRWLIRRHFRIGNLRSHALVHADGAGVVRRLARMARGALDIGAGVARAALAPRVDGRVRGLERAACGAGLIAGAIGYRYDEYRTVHGT